MLWRLKVYFQNQNIPLQNPQILIRKNFVAALASKQTHQYFLSVIFFIPEFIDWWFLDGDDDHGGKQSGNPHENQDFEGLMVVFANVTLKLIF